MPPKRTVEELEAETAAKDAALRGMEEEELNCTVCYKFMDGDIYMCANGHCICGACKKKVDRGKKECATCKDKAYANRNRPLEAIAKRMPARPCGNEECETKVKPGKEAEAHASDCSYRDLCCNHLYPACTFKCRTVSDFVSHLKEVHKVVEVGGADIKLVCTKDNAAHYTGTETGKMDRNHFVWHQLQKTDDGAYFLVRVHRKPRQTNNEANWVAAVGFLAPPGCRQLYHYTLSRSVFSSGTTFSGPTWTPRGTDTADVLWTERNNSANSALKLMENDILIEKKDDWFDVLPDEIESTNELPAGLRLVIRGKIGNLWAWEDSESEAE